MLPIAGNNGTFPFYQIGIISWGEGAILFAFVIINFINNVTFVYSKGCAQPNLPGVDTNVQYYADWINQKISL